MNALLIPLVGLLFLGPEDPPNRDGVICPEGFDDSIEYTVIETQNRDEADDVCRPFMGNLSPTVDIRGCTVDMDDGRLVVYAKYDYSTKDEELAHAACPSLGYDSLALDVTREFIQDR